MGRIEDHPCLHFELCYYQAIDWAIANGLSRVEAGRRASTSWPRLSADPRAFAALDCRSGFRDAVARYLREERRAVDEEIEVLTQYGPFRRVQSED